MFIPWQVLTWLLPAYVAVALLAMPTLASALSLLVSVYALKFGYEWTHYLVHSDYRPRSRWFRSVWRNHRLHHYKNEHYWFTVTTAGTADRLFGTYPEPATVKTSPTVKALHANERQLEPGRLLERRHLVAHPERQLLEQGQRRRRGRPRQVVADPARRRVADRRTERLREVHAPASPCRGRAG